MEPTSRRPGTPPERSQPIPDVTPRPRFKWWDAIVVVLFGQLIGATIGFSIGYSITGDEIGHPGAFTYACGFAGQFISYGIATWLFCRRRATGSLRRDLGWFVRPADWWALPLGTACAIGFGIVVAPLQHLVDQSQSVVDDLNDSSGAKLAVIAIAAGLLAPLFEELVFRGLLLRGLQNYMSDNWAIGTSATIFGCVHFLGGNALGTLAVLPALIGLGVVSGVLAVRSGNLSRSILLHMGFNLLAVVGALMS
jgi:uncharacterized protein